MTRLQLPDGVHAKFVTGRDPRGVWLLRTILWADLDVPDCPWCHEPVLPDVLDGVDVEGVGTWAPCPVVLNFDVPGAPASSVDEIHGCAAWIAPQWCVIPGDDPTEVAAAARELADHLAGDIAVARDRVRHALVARLAGARARLDAPFDDGETRRARDGQVLGDRDDEPGIFRGPGGLLVTWDDDPAGRDPDGIVVVEDREPDDDRDPDRYKTTVELEPGDVVNTGGPRGWAVIAAVRAAGPGQRAVDFTVGCGTTCSVHLPWLLLDDHVRERWINEDAQFQPMREDHEVPTLRIDRHVVRGYLDGGRLTIRISSDGEDGAGPRGVHPMHIRVEDAVVYAPGTPHGGVLDTVRSEMELSDLHADEPPDRDHYLGDVLFRIASELGGDGLRERVAAALNPAGASTGGATAESADQDAVDINPEDDGDDRNDGNEVSGGR